MIVRQWSEDLSVHHQGMDEQHKKLFLLAEYLWLSADKGMDLVQDAVSELIDYTYTHFASEEALLVSLNYPAFKDHKKKHEYIFNAVDKIVERYSTQDIHIFAKEAAVFVSEWLVGHIISDDMAYARFIAANRLRREGDGGTMVPANNVARAAQVAAAPIDPLVRLRKLKLALDEGLISQNDFETRKQQILNEI